MPRYKFPIPEDDSMIRVRSHYLALFTLNFLCLGYSIGAHWHGGVILNSICVALGVLVIGKES